MESQTLIASKFADAIKTLRASGRSDESITRTLGLTGKQALEHGLRHHADPDAAEKLKERARPDGAPDVTKIVRGGPVQARLVVVGARLLKFFDSREIAQADLYAQFDALRDDEKAEIIREGCRQVLAEASKKTRRSLFNEGGADRQWQPGDTEGEGMAARLRNAGDAYDWPLPGGKSIGGATLADLDAAIKFHDSHIAGHTRSRSLYQKVRDKLAESGKETVAEAISATDLEALQKESAP